MNRRQKYIAGLLVLCFVLFGYFAAMFLFAENYDHYAGTYAFKSTAYWPEFEISKDGRAFAFKHPGDDRWDISLKLQKGLLAGKDKNDNEIKITYDPATSEYVMSAVRQIPSSILGGRETVREKFPLIKVQPSPNEKLEKEYGVKAVDLVKKVRESEDWIHKDKSLKIIAKDKTGGVNIYFDDKRFRCFSYTDGRDESLKIWNGQEFIIHGKHYTHDQEYYTFRKELPDFNPLLLNLAWPRSKHHKFWWKNQDLDWGDYYGRAEDFIIVGKEKYRNTMCYVLECWPKEFRLVWRWFVGIEDGLKYGQLNYRMGQVSREYWTEDYKELKPGWWFPMKQGYHSFNYDEGKSSINSTREIMIEEVEVDKKLDDSLFVMEFKEGVEVSDDRFGGLITYKYKKDRTEEEWEQLRQKAQARTDRELKEKRGLDMRIGQDAIEFPKECKWLNTEPLTIEKLSGKTVILQFWGYWCGPCHTYMDMLKANQNNKNIIVIGIHTPEEDLNKIKDDMKKYKADGPICIDVFQDQHPYGLICEWYGVFRWPYWIVIGPDGKTAGHAGSPSEAFSIANKLKTIPQ